MDDSGRNLCQVGLQLVGKNWPLAFLAADDFAEIVFDAI
jgi:hypothetical protein